MKNRKTIKAATAKNNAFSAAMTRDFDAARGQKEAAELAKALRELAAEMAR